MIPDEKGICDDSTSLSCSHLEVTVLANWGILFLHRKCRKNGFWPSHLRAPVPDSTEQIMSLVVVKCTSPPFRNGPVGGEPAVAAGVSSGLLQFSSPRALQQIG